MRRTGWLLLMLALAGTGCISPLTRLDDGQHKAPEVQVAKAPPPPIVTPEEITEANYVQKVQDLSNELDHAENEQMAAPPAPARKTAKQ